MRKLLGLIIFSVLLSVAASPQFSHAASKADIDHDVDAALQRLYGSTPAAKILAEKAVGILVFPRIVKGGFLIGAQCGNGALRVGGETTGYYRSVALSYGLQVGVQWFGYALFFMDKAALDYLEKSKGWEIGVEPSVVIVDRGAAQLLSTTTAKDEIYVFIFGQRGLMMGVSLQTAKITRIDPSA